MSDGRQDRQRDREIAPGELLGDQRAGHGAALAAAAVGLVQPVRHQAELVGLAEGASREACRASSQSRAAGRISFCGELPHRLDDELLLFARFEVDHVGPLSRRARAATAVCPIVAAASAIEPNDLESLTKTRRSLSAGRAPAQRLAGRERPAGSALRRGRTSVDLTRLDSEIPPRVGRSRRRRRAAPDDLADLSVRLPSRRAGPTRTRPVR